MVRDGGGAAAPAPSARLLPAGVEEGLPPGAAGLEALRRAVLDLFAGWGYELVAPPFIEYLDSLLAGTGPDLDLQTFKVTDQASGRQLGLRADMTPQVAQIDAHRLAGASAGAPVRLCYAGTVLRARAGRPGASRCPVQAGAELYGHAGVESDLEALALMLEMLRCAGVERPHVDVGHLGVFRGLARGAGLDEAARGALFTALQRKAQAEIEELVAPLAEPWRGGLASLAELNGGPEALGEARRRLPGGGKGGGGGAGGAFGEDGEARAALREIEAALAALDAIAGGFERLGEPVHFDLAELRGYRYHGGLGFAAFVPGHGREIARGGRYDGITEVDGRPRPATGFSADLRTLHALGRGAGPAAAEEEPPGGVLAPAPWSEEGSAAEAEVRRLRAAGERVVYRLPGQAGGAREAGCDRVLARAGDGWAVAAAPEAEAGAGTGAATGAAPGTGTGAGGGG